MYIASARRSAETVAAVIRNAVVSKALRLFEVVVVVVVESNAGTAGAVGVLSRLLVECDVMPKTRFREKRETHYGTIKRKQLRE